MTQNKSEFIPLNIAVLTVSDTRNRENDTSGDVLETGVLDCGHKAVARNIVKDDIYALREIVSKWIADPHIHVILTTGGTGFSGRDSTPEALAPLFDKSVDGFGELFRALSYEEIGTSTIQSRVLAGIANRTLIFCLPGSSHACRTGWNRILIEQLDSRHKPCNFVGHVTGC